MVGENLFFVILACSILLSWIIGLSLWQEIVMVVLVMEYGEGGEGMMKEINYWKTIGISFILTTILYVITGLLLPISDPNSPAGLWTFVWGVAMIAMCIYALRKTGSKKEILYFVIVYLITFTLEIPGITIIVSTIYFAMTLTRVEKNTIGENK